MNPQHKWQSRPLARAVAAAALLASASTAHALSFDFGDDGEWTLDLDTNISYTAQWRVAKQDDDKFRYRDTGNLVEDLANYSVLINANDGNNNFNRSLVQKQGVHCYGDGPQLALFRLFCSWPCLL